MKIRNNISFSDDIRLIKYIGPKFDAYGNQRFEEEVTEILCNVSSVDRNQFYAAGNKNYKLSYVFTINGFEFEDQEMIEYKNKRFQVIRTYELDDGLLEITVGQEIGDRNV